MKGAILIAGPTASGKSALGIRLARRHNAVVINADSMQIYRDLQILSARPGADEQGDVPHRLYGVLDGSELCTAARWHDLAMANVVKVWEEGRLPVFLGGTGLYFRTLLDGLAPVPVIPSSVRETVRADMAARGPLAMHRDLAACDPVMAARLKPADSQRIARALEVFHATGRSLAAYQEDKRPGGLSAFDAEGRVVKAVLTLPREVLYARCDTRFLAMMEEGALDEVRALMARDLDKDLPVMKALGVPALSDYLDGVLSKEEAIAAGQRQTRHYAKRQMTWLRNQFPDWVRLDALDIEGSLSKLDAMIEERITH